VSPPGGAADVVVVGSLNGDYVIDVPRLPLPGDTVLGAGRPDIVFGGKGANQAAAAASLSGAEVGVAMVGCVGDDELGREMTVALADLGVDVSGIRTVPGPSGRATIAVDQAGQNQILVDVGANASLTIADVETDLVRDAVALLVQLESPPDAVAAALRAASGVRILNPAPAGGAAPLLALADIVVPNRTELALLAGARVGETLPEVMEQVRSLRLGGAVVVTLGAEGALLVDASGEPQLVPGLDVDVVDTTGAGDCFCGVLAVELGRGRSLQDAASAAVHSASLSVTGTGPRGRLPGPGDLAFTTGREI
jgi:ribokinase